MSNKANSYEQARAEYVRLLDEYEKALAHRDPDISDRFVEASKAWQRLRAVAPPESTEAKVGDDMHLVVAFSHAVGADHAQEAERIYEAMSDEARKNTDLADSVDHGSMKIWLRK